MKPRDSHVPTETIDDIKTWVDFHVPNCLAQLHSIQAFPEAFWNTRAKRLHRAFSVGLETARAKIAERIAKTTRSRDAFKTETLPLREMGNAVADLERGANETSHLMPLIPRHHRAFPPQPGRRFGRASKETRHPSNKEGKCSERTDANFS